MQGQTITLDRKYMKRRSACKPGLAVDRWVIVNTMVPVWVPIIIWHLLFRVPKRDLNFDNHPDSWFGVLIRHHYKCSLWGLQLEV